MSTSATPVVKNMKIRFSNMLSINCANSKMSQNLCKLQNVKHIIFAGKSTLNSCIFGVYHMSCQVKQTHSYF